MDNAKLKTLVDQQSASPNAAALGMAPPSEEEDMDDDEEGGMEEEPSDGDPVGRGNALIAEWGEFGKALEEEADEIHDLAHDVGAELLLKEVPKDALKAVGKAVDRMPDELSMGFAKYIAELSEDDCKAISAALAAKIGEDKADANLMYAFIHQAGIYAKDEIDVDEDFNVPEETDEDKADAEEPAVAEPAGEPPAP